MFEVFIIGAIVMTSLFVLCSCGIFCCAFWVSRNRRSQALHSSEFLASFLFEKKLSKNYLKNNFILAPVVVTSQSFQPVGSSSVYPVVVQTSSFNPSHNQHQQETLQPTVQHNRIMPLPPHQNNFQTPYPPSFSTTFQPSQYGSPSSVTHSMDTKLLVDPSNSQELPPTYEHSIENNSKPPF